jgi:hypothetical protein
MQPLLLLRPLAAEVRLCGPAIRPLPPMQGAADPILVEIGAGGNDLCLDGEIARPFHLAEIRRTARTHQGLQPVLPLGTHNLDLEVAATRRPTGIVRGSARGQSARIGRGENRKTTGGRRECPDGGPPVFDDEKLVPAQLARLLPSDWSAGRGSSEAIGGAAGGAPLCLQEAAGDVERGINVKLTLIFPDVIEADVLGVTNEPGGLVIQGGVPLFERTHPKDDRYRLALRTESVTGWGRGSLGPGFRFDCGFHAHPGRMEPVLT